MTNLELASLINFDHKDLMTICVKPRGTVIAWSIREVLRCKYYELTTNEIEMLKAMLVDCLHFKGKFTLGLQLAMQNGYVKIINDHLHDLIIRYSKHNPFGVNL